MIIKTALITQNCIAGKFDSNLKTTLSFIKKAGTRGAKIVVFPEMNLTGYVSGPLINEISISMDSEWMDQLSSAANQYNICILTGLAETDSSINTFATHLVIHPDQSVDMYRKTHLSPFEKEYFQRGNTINVFSIDSLKFGIQLCYDAHFPELSLNMALKGADIIFIPHASPRGTPDQKYDSWIRHLRARAFDNGIYIAACNQVGDNMKGLNFPGVSLLIGPDGNVISKELGTKDNLHFVDIDTIFLEKIRSHKMRYFLPNRRPDLFSNY